MAELFVLPRLLLQRLLKVVEALFQIGDLGVLIVLVLLAGGLFLVAFTEQTGELHAAQLRAYRRIGSRLRRIGRTRERRNQNKSRG